VAGRTFVGQPDAVGAVVDVVEPGVGRSAAQAAEAAAKAELERSGTPSVTVTPCSLRQLVYAANAALLAPWPPKSNPPPLGLRLAHAFSAAAYFGLLANPPAPRPGKEPLPGVPPDPGVNPPSGPPPPEGRRPLKFGRVTPCCERHLV
jgi:hypothetical protein